MKKLNITKERFEKSRYFTKKYGKLEYVSESGKVFKTDKGKVLMFKEGQYHNGWYERDAFVMDKGLDAACENLKPGQIGITIEDFEEVGPTWTIWRGYGKKSVLDRFVGSEETARKRFNNIMKREMEKIGEPVEGDVDYFEDFMQKYSSKRGVKESTRKFGRKFKESHTYMSTIEEKLAAALDAEIRTMTPDDIQVVSETSLDETGVSTIFVLLQNAFQSKKFTDEEKKKILNSDPKLISQMVLDIIDRSLPQSKGALVLALGLARETVKKMSDTDWKDIVEYALNNPDGL